VWLNCEVVHANDVPRGLTLNADIVPVTLRAGDNDLLIKVTQGGGDWQFAARLRTSEGLHLDGVTFKVPAGE
jgi:hypothetical protein